MQRQLSGSPGLNGGGMSMQRQLSSSAMPKLQLNGNAGVGGEAAAMAMAVPEEQMKAEKPTRSAPGKERTIHLIPLLTFFCFLLLFLCSHDPSPSDLSTFGGGQHGNRKLRMF